MKKKMGLVLLFPLMVVGESGPSDVAEKNRKPLDGARLEINSKEKVRFLGLCVSEDGKHEKKIEGVAPAEFQLDMKLHRCEIKPEDKKKSLGIRLFHQRQIIFEKTKPEAATSGIEFVIPWGK